MLIAEMNINILLKKPAKGGIPHIENIIIENDKANCGLDMNSPERSFKYFSLLKLPCFLMDNKIEKVATVIIMYMIT